MTYICPRCKKELSEISYQNSKCENCDTNLFLYPCGGCQKRFPISEICPIDWKCRNCSTNLEKMKEYLEHITKMSQSENPWTQNPLAPSNSDSGFNSAPFPCGQQLPSEIFPVSPIPHPDSPEINNNK